MSTTSVTLGRPLTVAGDVAPGPSRGAPPRPLAPVDMQNGGTRRIAGTTKNTGTPNTPVRRRVRLHDQLTGRLVSEAWSDPATGAYSFDGIRTGTYYVTAFDHTGTYGAVIADNLTPEPMP